MEDRNLEKKLKDLKAIVQRDLMRDWGFSAEMRAKVHEMANPGRKGGISGIKAAAARLLAGPWLRRLALVAAAALAVCGVFAALNGQPRENLLIRTVEERQVDFDGRWPPDLVRTVEINDSSMEGTGYLTMIWAADGGNGWHLLYSAPCRKNNLPLPIKTVHLTGGGANLVLVSSKEEQSDLLNYRVLGYDGRQVIIYLDRSFIPQGRVETGPGYVKETGAGSYSIFWWSGNGFEEEIFPDH